jgi:hypothetical protein
MGKCPKCGEVLQAKKVWKMAGRPDPTGARIQLEIGLFECPKCSCTFREVLSKTKVSSDGRPQAQPISNCKSCGNDNPIEYHFCGKCGASLRDEPTRIY